MESGWLVEMMSESRPLWLAKRIVDPDNEAGWLFRWTTVANEALRFKTRQSAQQEAATVSKLARVDAFPAEHVWG